MIRRFLILGFLVLTLMFISSSGPKVSAFDACTDCVTNYFSCRGSCYSSYDTCMIEIGSEEVCFNSFYYCQLSCDSTYSQCQLTHCGSGGGPAVTPGGCGYSIYSLYPSLRDECIAGISFMDVFEQCENVSPSQRETCCNGQYDYYLSTVCQCNLDPRVPSCSPTPP